MDKRTATIDGMRVVTIRMEGFGEVETTTGAIGKAMTIPKQQLARKMAEACGSQLYGPKDETALVSWWMAHPKAVIAVLWAGTAIESLV